MTDAMNLVTGVEYFELPIKKYLQDMKEKGLLMA